MMLLDEEPAGDGVVHPEDSHIIESYGGDRGPAQTTRSGASILYPDLFFVAPRTLDGEPGMAGWIVGSSKVRMSRHRRASP